MRNRDNSEQLKSLSHVQVHSNFQNISMSVAFRIIGCRDNQLGMTGKHRYALITPDLLAFVIFSGTMRDMISTLFISL